MKNVIFIITMLSCGVVFGQQKKSNKTPFKVPEIKQEPKEEPPPPPPAPSSSTISETENCFLFRQEESKDSLVYVTENLLEYGWNGDNARMLISSSNYDPVKKQEAEKQGMRLMQTETVQYIDGTFKIVKGILTFEPMKTEISERRTFKLIFKPKTRKIDYLRDENGNKYNKGKCPENTISVGM